MTDVRLVPGMTLAAARQALAQAFRRHGIDSAQLDARILIGHALGLDQTQLATTDRVLDAHDLNIIEVLTERRLAGEPIARIVGIKEFWGLPLALSPAALVPRPETETVVAAALAAAGATEAHMRRSCIADLGTGSGALLLALLSELPAAFGIGTDRSAEAVLTARGNARNLGLDSRAHFTVCDFGAALAGGFDLVVSNPPYVVRADIATLAPEVRGHDPRLALDGGGDGLDCYRAIAADARRLLVPQGALVLELGAGQAAAVGKLLTAAGLRLEGKPRADLAGIPRALVARP